MNIKRIGKTFENIKYFFLYKGCNFYPFDRELNDIINKFFEISEEKIKIYFESHYMTFRTKKYELRVWSENRWYAFASTIKLREDGYGIIFDRDRCRPSYKNLYFLKKIFIERKLKQPTEEYLRTMESLQKNN